MNIFVGSVKEFQENINYLSTEGINSRILEIIGYIVKIYDIKGVITMVVKRGDIYYADLRPVVGSEQGGVRPVLIIQNDMGNRYSPTVICAAITSKLNKAKLPTHISLDSENYGIVKDSVILLEQVRTIDKSRLKEKVCHLDERVLREINKALAVSLDLNT